MLGRQLIKLLRALANLLVEIVDFRSLLFVFRLGPLLPDLRPWHVLGELERLLASGLLFRLLFLACWQRVRSCVDPHFLGVLKRSLQFPLRPLSLLRTNIGT